MKSQMNLKTSKKQINRTLIRFFNSHKVQSLFVVLVGFLSVLTVVRGLLILKDTARFYGVGEYFFWVGLLVTSALFFFFTSAKLFMVPIKSSEGSGRNK